MWVSASRDTEGWAGYWPSFAQGVWDSARVTFVRRDTLRPGFGWNRQHLAYSVTHSEACPASGFGSASPALCLHVCPWWAVFEPRSASLKAFVKLCINVVYLVPLKNIFFFFF